jgi:hypothetical protein
MEVSAGNRNIKKYQMRFTKMQWKLHSGHWGDNDVRE